MKGAIYVLVLVGSSWGAYVIGTLVEQARQHQILAEQAQARRDAELRRLT